MRYITVVLAFFCFASSFAQSKKKKNEHLKLELKAKQESYDSLRYVYYFETYELEKGVKKNYQELMIAFPKKEREIDNLELAIEENQAKLTKLKEPFSSLKDVQLPNYSFTSNLKKELSSFNPIYEEVSKARIPDEKLKVQNQYLENRIHVFDSLFLLNEQTIRNLRLCKSEVGSLCTTLTDQLKVYDDYAVYLKEENDQLESQLHELAENYFSKGPRGFSSEYHEVFPDGRTSTVVRELDEPEVYSGTTEDATFPGGNAGLKYYLETYFHIPQIALEMGLEGKVWIRFVIKEDGAVSEVKVIRGITDCPECDQEAMRVIKRMPAWKPARVDGRAVKCMFQIPIEIKLN